VCRIQFSFGLRILYTHFVQGIHVLYMLEISEGCNKVHHLTL